MIKKPSYRRCLVSCSGHCRTEDVAVLTTKLGLFAGIGIDRFGFDLRCIGHSIPVPRSLRKGELPTASFLLDYELYSGDMRPSDQTEDALAHAVKETFLLFGRSIVNAPPGVKRVFREISIDHVILTPWISKFTR